MAVSLDYQPLAYNRSIVIRPKTQMIFVVFLALALMLKVFISNSVTQLGYRLSEVKKERIELDLQRRELELQLSVLLRPDQLAQRAKQKLGLTGLDPSQARRIRY